MIRAIETGVAAGQTAVLSLGEWQVSSDPEAVLVCLGLGSCIALCMHDRLHKIGGMAHMVLPDSTAGRATASAAKFVDLAVPMLLDAMIAAGAIRSRISVDLVGGASMLGGAVRTATSEVGARNAEAAHAALKQLGLRVRNAEIGGHRGRTVRLSVATGELEVSTARSAARA